MGRRGYEVSKRGWEGSATLADKGLDCTVEVYMSEESAEDVTVLRVGRQQWGWGGSSKSESCQEFWIWRGKIVSTLDGPIWSRCSIALTCPARSHFQRTLSKERWGQGLDERYRSSTEGVEWGDEDGQEKGRRKEKTGDRFLRKLCAALLRSFRGKHSEKMKGGARGNWDPWKGQQSFRPNLNGVGDRTTTLTRLLIGAVFPDFVYPDSESKSPIIEFKPRAPHTLPERPARWLPTLVNTVFCRVSLNSSAVPYKNGTWVNEKLYRFMR